MKRLALLAWFAGAGAAACTDAGVRPSAVTQAADSADQVLLKMATKITNDGVLRSFVEADTAYLYQRSQTTEMRRFTARFLDENGNLKSTLTADLGLYLTYSNKLDARGHVIVVSTDGRKLVTEHLIYDKMANQIMSDTAFVYDSKTEHVTGNGFTSDIDFKNLKVEQPKGFQRGRGVLLPGQ
jgi:LPS export ABC transporter protein LptC